MATAVFNTLPEFYVALSEPELEERIAGAKAELGSRLVILGHHYQRDEVVKFADFRGDSLKLSQLAAAPAGSEVHRLLRRTLHGRECGYIERRPSNRNPSRLERRLFDGGHG